MFNPEQATKLLDNATKLSSTNSTIRSGALSLLNSLSGSSDPFQNAAIYSSSSNAGGAVYLGEGRHWVTTGLGDDQVYVGAENDFVDAGDGNNTLFLGEGFSVSIVGAGNNTIYGGSASDVVNAGDGNNTLYLGEGVNVAVSGFGDDLIYVGAADDVIKAGDGNNTIYAAEGHNFVWTGKGNDLIYAGAGDDVIFSGAGNDTTYAGEGNNFISVGTGEDTVYAGSGRDRFELTKGLGAVTIIGFGGNDSLRLANGITPGSVSFTSQNGDTIVKLGDDVLAILKWVNLSSTNIDNSPAPMQIETIPTRKIDPSNSLIGAQIIDVESLINAPKNFITDAISVTNPIDNFRFTLTKSRDFSIVLSGLSADADIKLIQDRNNNGVADSGELIYFSQNSGLQKDFLSINELPTGTYYVQIYQGLSTSQTDYSVEFLEDLILSPLPTEDLASRYEQLARGIAYEDNEHFEELGVFEFSLDSSSISGKYLAPGDYVLDYSYRVDEVFRDGQTGFFAVGLIPNGRYEGFLSPVLAVRGTDDVLDFFQDINPNGVGIDQFLNNRDEVENWLDKVSSIALPDITGHSLGGALAQRIAADYTAKGNKMGQVITFNSPGINYVNVATFRPENIEGITHYVVVGDLVSLAGQAFLPGNVVLLNWSDVDTNPAVGLNLLKKHGGIDRLDPARISTDEKGGIGIGNIYTSSLTLSDPLFTYYAYDNADWLAFNTLLISPLLLPFGGGALSAALSTRATVEISREVIGLGLLPVIDTILGIQNFDFIEWAKRILIPYGREEVRVLKDKIVEIVKEDVTVIIEKTENLGSSIGSGAKKIFGF
jgi:RTX calcium-binding nonapeptide repeat (4 copies)/Lipase (class 3)